MTILEENEDDLKQLEQELNELRQEKALDLYEIDIHKSNNVNRKK